MQRALAGKEDPARTLISNAIRSRPRDKPIVPRSSVILFSSMLQLALQIFSLPKAHSGSVKERASSEARAGR